MVLVSLVLSLAEHSDACGIRVQVACWILRRSLYVSFPGSGR